jgi:hypothetical protein
MMKLVETKISDKFVYMRYADNPDSAEARVWIDFQVSLKDLSVSDGNHERPLGDPEIRYLGLVRQAALRYARKLIGEETQRLADHIGRNT